jgi:flagellar protein FlbD
MIRLTRLNNTPITINSDLIKLMENAPDTVITLVTGEKIVVLESSDEVVQRIVDFRRRILSALPLSITNTNPNSSAIEFPLPAHVEAEKG